MLFEGIGGFPPVFLGYPSFQLVVMRNSHKDERFEMYHQYPYIPCIKYSGKKTMNFYHIFFVEQKSTKGTFKQLLMLAVYSTAYKNQYCLIRVSFFLTYSIFVFLFFTV